jgi:hypothetical protein
MKHRIWSGVALAGLGTGLSSLAAQAQSTVQPVISGAAYAPAGAAFDGGAILVWGPLLLITLLCLGGLLLLILTQPRDERQERRTPAQERATTVVRMSHRRRRRAHRTTALPG